MRSPVAIDGGCPDCECEPGAVEACYPGPEGTEGVSRCKAGERTCGEDGKFESCAGAVIPASESCNGLDDDCDGLADEDFGQQTCGVGACEVTVSTCVDGGPVACVPLRPAVREACEGTDDDCDGEVDEGCACLDGQTQGCFSGPAPGRGVGACKDGLQTCAQGSYGSTCPGEVLPLTEQCNGTDDDCDGLVDETDPLLGAYCATGLPGICASGTNACDGGVLTCIQLRKPGLEACNGADDDCDGFTDEDGPQAGEDCSTGLLGVCAAGTTVCQAEAIVCTGKTAPSTERCDGLDNNCNGVTDEGNPDAGLPCTTGLLGVCSGGTTHCAGGNLDCIQTRQPSAEVCNASDDDCDGAVDNSPMGVGQACSTTLPGVCGAGVTVCGNGASSCQQTTQASAEVCNALDDDCDGTADDGNPGGGLSCSTGLSGVCAAGLTACVAGVVTCQQSVQSSAETCDGRDNDCDGSTDEGDLGGNTSCVTGQPGICAAGTTHCTGGQLQCTPDTTASSETCDGFDNDCDGTADDGNPGGGAACDTGQLGECRAGVTSCGGGTLSCLQSTQASVEVCDGRDNDCDGSVDDGNPGGGGSCSTGLSGVCGAGTSACGGGVAVCNQNVQAAPETCDGRDEDCDGWTDEGNPGGGLICNTGQAGQCAVGTTACSGGGVQCVANTPASAEVCDGVDNDCDGTVDDGNPGGSTSCSTGLQGVCAPGVTRCTGGAVLCEQTTQASAEICDGRDNDCDGSVDQGNPGGGGACNTGLLGVCSVGTTSCSGGVLLCPQNEQSSAESCNAKDDDCDGTTDEDFDKAKDPNNCGTCGNVCGSAAGGLCCSSTCVTPGVSNCGACGVSCASSTLVINEVLIDPGIVSDTQGEWFEVYNPGTVAIDMRGFVFRDLGMDTHTITAANPVLVPPGGYAVLGINANSSTNGGVALTYQYSSTALGNSGDELVLQAHGVELDRLVWGGTFDPLGKSKELSRNHRTAAQNDTLANWCEATATFGSGDYGTPGAANDCAK